MSKAQLKMFVIFLCMTVVLGQVYAQISKDRRFIYPMTEDGGGSSFRQKDMVEQGTQNLQPDQNLLDRGAMLTQPGTWGLVYQVHVLGEVKNPGTYRVMASERLAEALQKAGGIDEQGSQRRIEIRRGGNVVKTIDLLEFQRYGKLDHNPYLLDNDVIYVPLKRNTVQVVGAVKRPATYDLAGEKTAWDVIQLAGGFSSGIAKNESVRVVRFVNSEKKVEEISTNEPALSHFPIQNGDVVVVPSVITAGRQFDYDVVKLPGDNVFYPSYEDRVFVLGGVYMPGAYPFSPYYNLHQYISLAGGYTQMATGSIKLLRPDGRKVSLKSNKEVKINPGDTIVIGERRIPPEGWVNLFMSLGSFGLSTTATVLTLTR